MGKRGLFDPPFKGGLTQTRRRKNPGNVLLSHQVALAVPLAMEGLTAVFGMGTGVTPPPRSPGKSVAVTLSSSFKGGRAALDSKRRFRKFEVFTSPAVQTLWSSLTTD
jgi:hypothetical protein